MLQNTKKLVCNGNIIMLEFNCKFKIFQEGDIYEYIKNKRGFITSKLYNINNCISCNFCNISNNKKIN